MGVGEEGSTITYSDFIDKTGTTLQPLDTLI